MRVIIRYGDGSQEEIPVRGRIHERRSTPHHRPSRALRIIQSVDLWYSKDRWNSRPKVTFTELR